MMWMWVWVWVWGIGCGLRRLVQVAGEWRSREGSFGTSREVDTSIAFVAEL
jgi:hypothetical protein